MSQRKEKYARRVSRDLSALELARREDANFYAAQLAALTATEQELRKRSRDRTARELDRLRRAHNRLAVTLMVLTPVLVFLLIMTLTTTARSQEYPAEPPAATVDEPTEDHENPYIEEALLSRANKLENVKITHACAEPFSHICGTGDGITASGVPATPYVSVAVDPSIIPLGSEVMIDYGDGDIQYYRADDVGGGVNGNHVDVCVAWHQEALALGVKTATVYWVAPA